MVEYALGQASYVDTRELEVAIQRARTELAGDPPLALCVVYPPLIYLPFPLPPNDPPIAGLLYHPSHLSTLFLPTCLPLTWPLSR